MIIDISHWQGNVDFNAVKASGVDGVILKLSQNQVRDNCFNKYYDACEAAGLPVGCYIYNKTQGLTQAKAEAEFAAKQLVGKKMPLGVWLDIEDKSLLTYFTKAQLTQMIDAEALILRNAGFNVGLYMNVDWSKNKIEKSVQQRFPMWIAGYSNKWEAYAIEIGAVLWQYTSDGIVKGINTRVDMDKELVDITGAFRFEKPSAPKMQLVRERTLKQGCKGEDVRKLQMALNLCGYNLDTDGNFGKLTYATVIDFQRKHGLVVDGLVGKNTVNKINEVIK